MSASPPVLLTISTNSSSSKLRDAVAVGVALKVGGKPAGRVGVDLIDHPRGAGNRRSRVPSMRVPGEKSVPPEPVARECRTNGRQAGDVEVERARLVGAADAAGTVARGRPRRSGAVVEVKTDVAAVVEDERAGRRGLYDVILPKAAGRA